MLQPWRRAPSVGSERRREREGFPRSRTRSRPSVEGLEQRSLLAVDLTEIAVLSPNGAQGAIATGPDGSVWFADG
jgi:hypothetical protein